MEDRAKVGYDGAYLHDDRAGRIVDRLTESIRSDERIRHISTAYLPHRHAIVEVLERLVWLVFPGFVGPRTLSDATLREHVESLVTEVRSGLAEQVSAALRYARHIEIQMPSFAKRSAECDARAALIVDEFLETLPAIRAMLSLDVQAAYDGDPAAHHTDETIFCYPGVRALTIQRLAHQLYRLDVPLMPRIMTEHAHSVTGIDIHPGAKIGKSFFIDHGTGVVIGETAVIGDHCRLYQGVTLGAANFPRDANGNYRRNVKRHPTLEDHVTVYAAATILGGDTVIGGGSVVNGGVFLTHSIPPGTIVRAPKVEVRTRSNPELPPANYTI